MDLRSPVLDVAAAVRGALLQALARLEQPVTRRQLAGAAGVAPGNASTVIEDLIRSGIVTETAAGRSSMVSLNRGHLAAGPLLALAGLRGELIRRLRERLSAWPDLRGAWLFGSVARGEAHKESDIDLLIVADDGVSSSARAAFAVAGRRPCVDRQRPPARRALADLLAKARAVEEPTRGGDPPRWHRSCRSHRRPDGAGEVSRSKGSRKLCDARQARQRLVDARQLLEAAKLLDAPDVVATNAIHAAIAAADAMTCHAVGESRLREHRHLHHRRGKLRPMG